MLNIRYTQCQWNKRLHFCINYTVISNTVQLKTESGLFENDCIEDNKASDLQKDLHLQKESEPTVMIVDQLPVGSIWWDGQSRHNPQRREAWFF